MLGRCLLIAAVVGACAGTAMADRVQARIVNGVFTSQHPTVAAVLKGTTAGTAAQWCTATLIGCQTVLTAAHCVCDADGGSCQPGQAQEPQPRRYFVFLQHAGTFAVDRITVNPSYKADVGDIAVLHLATPVTGIAPTPINRTGTPPHGTAGTLVGFGRQGGQVSDYGLKRTGDISVAACAAHISNETSVCWNFSAPEAAAGSNSNTCHGDSGGPLFVDFGCGPIVVGVTTDGRNPDCTLGDQSWDANVYAYRSFIDAAAPGDLNRDSCGLGPQVGDPSVAVTGQVATLSPSVPDDFTAIQVTPNTAELRVTLNGVDTPSLFENFDLYLRFGAAPTTDTFDCRATGTSQFGDCVVANPTAGTWYAAVHRVSGSGTYQLTATTFPIGESTNQHQGLTCDDGSLCTTDDTCHAGQCVGVAAPLTACQRPTVSARSHLLLHNLANNHHDTMRWTASHLPVRANDLGDPTTTTAYEICVFDAQSGTPHLALDSRVPAGAGWTRTARHLTFHDRSATYGGIRSLRLRTSPTNGAIHLRGAGLHLPTPQLPLALEPQVRIQISNGGACWEADFSRTQRNQAQQFRARSD